MADISPNEVIQTWGAYTRVLEQRAEAVATINRVLAPLPDIHLSAIRRSLNLGFDDLEREALLAYWGQVWDLTSNAPPKD